MRCSACQTENRVERKFCAGCGAGLVQACIGCGAANLPGERFCGECGRPLDATGAAATGAPRTSPPAPVPGGPGPAAERRLVSVLFADLVGSTAMAETRDPEVVREVLTAWYTAARAVIERYGGTVEKYIGDAVMAVWGAPTAHEDDAERAVRAALDLVDAVGGLSAAHADAPGLALRAAVMTGEVAVTIGAEGQGLVAGDLVNTAARLQAIAAPGSVVVGEATMLASRDAIEFQPGGRHEVKGRAGAVEAWLAVQVVAGRRGVGRAERPEGPFVGRTAELRTLKEALATTTTEGRARLVVITGQAGIGKSRLAWELEKHVDGVVEDIYWHRGRSPAYGDGIAFWALAEMVRSRVGLLEGDAPPLAAERLASVLEVLVADAAERRWMEPHLRALLGLGGPAAGDRSEQFGAWRGFVEAIAAQGTTALVFEDLQWADDGTLDFIDTLLEWSRSLPILVVALARPELLERRPTLVTGGRNAISIHLEPLRPGEMRELVDGLAPDLDTGLASAVVERAEGIPLYAVELLRMLRTGDVPAPSGAVDRLTLPPSLRALVAARLDSLSAEDRALLQDAAVLGQTFSAAALAAVSGEEREALEPRLRGLVRREYLTVDVDPRSPERGQYGFVQAVVHEVAYGLFSRRDRRARHLAAARYLDAIGEESLATVVATHYLEAYRAAPDDEQGRVIRSQARVALRAAAERAARLHNYRQAVTDLERAVELTDAPEDRAAMLIAQAEWLAADARFEPAIAAFERAEAAYAALGDQDAMVRATASRGRAVMESGHWVEAGVLFERTLAGLDPDRDPANYARCAAELARTAMIRDDSADGAVWAERALAAAGPIRLIDVIAEAMDTKGVCVHALGRLDEGVALIRASLELAAEHHLSAAELRARYNLAGRLLLDDPEASASVARAGMEVATRTGRRDWLLSLSMMLTTNLLPTRFDYDEALAVCASVEVQDPPLDILADAIIARAYVGAMRGDRSIWTRDRKRALAAIQGQSNALTAWTWAVFDALVALAEGRLADAAASATSIGGPFAGWGVSIQARAALRARDAGALRAACGRTELVSATGNLFVAERLAFAAGLAALEGRPDEAIAGYREARRVAREHGHLVTLVDLLMDAVTVLGPGHPETPLLADEVRSLLEKERAQALIDRLEDALSGGPRPALISG